jgi:hypothetical protein
VRFIRKLDETVAGDAEIIKKNNYAGITMKQEYFVDVESISVPWKQIVKRESPGDLFRVKLEEAGITDPTGSESEASPTLDSGGSARSEHLLTVEDSHSSQS